MGDIWRDESLSVSERHTARTEDLVKLLKADHPYIRIYAFGALARRGHPRLFQVLVENLGDTTTIESYTGDSGEFGYPADLMVWYVVRQLSVPQKDSLKKLMLTKYSHLNSLLYVLLFHKPSEDEYECVRAIAMKDNKSVPALVALAKYQREQDVPLIKAGFDFFKGPWYNDLFYAAIESFPHKAFEQRLIDASKEKGCEALVYNEHYLRALAKYKTKECLRVLNDYAREYMVSNSRLDPEERKANLSRIYHALKRYHTPMYDKLMSEIIKNTAGEIDEEEYLWYRTDNPWDY